MAVFRIERTRDYTVMSNHHLRNHELSLKAKGLLSMMLSLPDDWNYTTRGLAKICKEGVDAIGNALRELETAGYIVRHQLRDRQGRISDTEYVIYEQPQPRQPETPGPDTAEPDTASPYTENPYMDKPDTEKPAELNIEKSNTQKSITQGASTDSIPFREPAAAQLPERKGRDAMSVSEMESYRDLILENIEYDHLCREFATYREDLDEIVELMVETVCAKRKTTRIAGSDFPHEVVRSRFLKLDCSHIEFVMECLRNNMGIAKAPMAEWNRTRKPLRWYSSFSSLPQPALERQPLPGNFLSEVSRPPENTKQLMGSSTTMSHAPVAAGVALRFSVSWRTNAISAPMSSGVVLSLKWAAHGAAGRIGTSGSLFPTIIRQSLTKNCLKRCRLCSAGFPCRPGKPRSTH